MKRKLKVLTLFDSMEPTAIDQDLEADAHRAAVNEAFDCYSSLQTLRNAARPGAVNGNREKAAPHEGPRFLPHGRLSRG